MLKSSTWKHPNCCQLSRLKTKTLSKNLECPNAGSNLPCDHWKSKRTKVISVKSFSKINPSAYFEMTIFGGGHRFFSINSSAAVVWMARHMRSNLMIVIISWLLLLGCLLTGDWCLPPGVAWPGSTPLISPGVSRSQSSDLWHTLAVFITFKILKRIGRKVLLQNF